MMKRIELVLLSSLPKGSHFKFRKRGHLQLVSSKRNKLTYYRSTVDTIPLNRMPDRIKCYVWRY